MATWTDSPLKRSAAASLPLLIEAHRHLYASTSPRASRLADRIARLMAETVDLAGDVEAYGDKCCGGALGDLADRIREATREYEEAGK